MIKMIPYMTVLTDNSALDTCQCHWNSTGNWLTEFVYWWLLDNEKWAFKSFDISYSNWRIAYYPQLVDPWRVNFHRIKNWFSIKTTSNYSNFIANAWPRVSFQGNLSPLAANWPGDWPGDWLGDWPGDWPGNWPGNWPGDCPGDLPSNWPGNWPDVWPGDWLGDWPGNSEVMDEEFKKAFFVFNPQKRHCDTIGEVI